MVKRLSTLTFMALVFFTTTVVLTSPAYAAKGPDYKGCAKVCAQCRKDCLACHQHCLGMIRHGMKEHTKSAALCADCADLCVVSEKLLARKGPMSAAACKACADAAAACAAECRKYPNMPIMKHCAGSCDKCVKACNALVASLQ